jgi:XapX domain-containing protein
MKPYLLSLAAGLLVGVIYGLINVRSPAPPVIALVGLLGILAGEQIPPWFKQVLSRQTSAAVWVGHQVKPHVFGNLPCGQPPKGPQANEIPPEERDAS